MAASSGPDIVDSGLVLALDAADINSFDKYENLALNSESVNSWANNGSAISISANSQIAPDGTLTADVLSQTAVTGASRWVSSTTRTYTAGVTYTLSIWLKKISGTDAQPTINLWVNGGTQQSVGTITTEWVRYSKSFTPVSTISSNTFTGLDIGWNTNGVANNFTFAAWGFQLEVGSTATDYYRTTGTAKNRGSTIIDLSGNGNTGTLTNGPTYSSSNGGSIVFDGTNDWASFSSNSSYNVGTGDFSAFCWMKSNNKSDFQTLLSLDDAATGNGILFYTAVTSGVFRTWIGGSVRNGSIDICNDVWNFVGVTRNSGTVTQYINSISNGTYVASGSVSANQNLRLGSYGSGYYLNGNIAQVQIYNRALTAAEVQQNFNAVRSRFGI